MTTVNPSFDIVVYAAKMKDGTYRCVEAVSWEDALQHLGDDALDVRARMISMQELDAAWCERGRRDIYETGRVNFSTLYDPIDEDKEAK